MTKPDNPEGVDGGLMQADLQRRTADRQVVRRECRRLFGTDLHSLTGVYRLRDSAVPGLLGKGDGAVLSQLNADLLAFAGVHQSRAPATAGA
jgi:hypothetical protein